MDEAEFAAAGLYDPAAPDAADRLELLRHLADAGASLEEMTAARALEQLPWLGVDRLLRPVAGRSLEEVAVRVGVAPEQVERAQRALGLPPLDGPSYTEAPITSFATAAAFFGTERTLQFSRVVGASLTRIVDAAMSIFLADFDDVLTNSSELAVAQRSEDATRLLLDLPATISALFPAYVNDAVRRLRMTGQESSGALTAAIGFVDLVDSTRLVQRLSGPELASAVGDFETAAYEVALGHDARVVKFIGDAAMFFCADPAEACLVGHGLCDVVAAHPVLTQARAAIAYGHMVARDGDFYGSVVNLASRLTSVAAPGQVLCNADVRAAVDPDSTLQFTPAGAHVLRGFDDPVTALAVVR